MIYRTPDKPQPGPKPLSLPLQTCLSLRPWSVEDTKILQDLADEDGNVPLNEALNALGERSLKERRR